MEPLILEKSQTPLRGIVARARPEGSSRPNIYEYLDYRPFLRNMFEHKKRESSGFSHRIFARLAGLKSSNFLKLVMDGERNLSREAVFRFAQALRLSKAESNFFESLVFFSQAKNTDEKNRYYERISQSKSFTQIRELDGCQYAYFSKWYYVAIRELVSLKGFREDPEWINRKLKISLSSEEIRKVIRILEKLNLLKRDPLHRLIQTESSLVTSPEIRDLAVLNFHKEMIAKACQSLESSRTADRDISTLTISLTRERFQEIQGRINEFRRELHALASATDGAEAVFQINFQLFNLTEVPWT